MNNFFIDTTNWNMERKYVIRRRVAFTILAAVVLGLVWAVATNVWWTEQGYCFGSMEKCFPGMFGK